MDPQAEYRQKMAQVKQAYADAMTHITRMHSELKAAVFGQLSLREQNARLERRLADNLRHTPNNLKRRTRLLSLLATEYMDLLGTRQKSLNLPDGRIFTMTITDAPQPQPELTEKEEEN